MWLAMWDPEVDPLRNKEDAHYKKMDRARKN